MFTLKATNKYNETIELTNNDAYVITNIEGLDPPDATINMTKNATADGSEFNSASVGNRQIIITLAINSPAEDNRINLYKYFKSKYPVTLHYVNEHRNVEITGYCQSMPINLFGKKQTEQIVIICPEPFFKGTRQTTIELSAINPLFEFPFSIEEGNPIPFSEITSGQERILRNIGDVETGVVFTLHARGIVSTPTIYNVNTNEYMTLNVDIKKGDEITVNTNKNQKSITMYSDGEKKSIIGKLASGSTWLSLNPDSNVFKLYAKANVVNLDVLCEIIPKYEGV